MTPTPETTPVAETLSFGEQSAEAFAATIESTTDTRVAELEAQIAELKDWRNQDFFAIELGRRRV